MTARWDDRGDRRLLRRMADGDREALAELYDRHAAALFRHAMALASTVVALRRCRLERGSCPESLDGLVPDFLSQVPVDPFTGRGPEYVRTGAGSTLCVAAAAGTPEQAKDLLRWSVSR